MKKVKTETVRL